MPCVSNQAMPLNFYSSFVYLDLELYKWIRAGEMTQQIRVLTALVVSQVLLSAPTPGSSQLTACNSSSWGSIVFWIWLSQTLFSLHMPSHRLAHVNIIKNKTRNKCQVRSKVQRKTPLPTPTFIHTQVRLVWVYEVKTLRLLKYQRS